MMGLRGSAIATWARHQEALRSLDLTLAALRAASVPVLVVKGAVLAYSLYDDVASRPISDVDLRVRPCDAIRAVRAIRARGFRTDWTSRQLGAIAFVVGNVSIELEATVGPPGMCALSVDTMLHRSVERVLPGDLRVREPELHDHTVLMVVNAFKDKLVDCMPWSLDDLETMAGRIDVDIFVERVRASRVRTMTWIVAEWMARERKSTRWGSIRERLGRRAPRPAYAWAVRHLITKAPRSFLLPAVARVASDSSPHRLLALAATGIGLGVTAAGRRFD